MQGRQFDSSPRTERQVEQKVIEHDTDIKRLFKRLQDLYSLLGAPPGDTSGTVGGVAFGGGGSLEIGLGKTDASVTAGSSVTVSIYDPGATPASDTDSTNNITCYSRVDIDSGIFVNYVDRGDYNECFPLECNA